MSEPAELTRDEILRGQLSLWQPRQGYRFSVDALLLARFARDAAGDRAAEIADLGAGCGVVGLALARALPAARVTLVELQPRLAALCRQNATENELAPRVTVCEADLRALRGVLPGETFHHVVSNPPYRPAGQGRVSPDPERALANAEGAVTLEQVVAAAARLLRPRGTLSVVYPAERLPALLAACAPSDLRPVRLRLVHPRAGAPARRLLLTARKGAGAALVVEPPLVVHEGDDAYTAQVAAILDGED